MKNFEEYRNLYEKATQERPDIFKLNTGIAMIKHMSWCDKDYTVSINRVVSKFPTKEEAEEFIFSKGYTIPCPSLAGYEKKIMNPEIRAEYEKTQQTIEEIETATVKLTNIIFDIVKLTGKKTYIRYGLIPESGKSYNFRENISENGVSCFEAYKLGKDYIIDVAGGYFTFLGYAGSKTAYEITGEELLEKGSDGEPLLKDAKIIKKIRKTNGVYDIKSWIPTVFEKEEN